MVDSCLVKRIHALYYDDELYDDPIKMIAFHDLMGELFSRSGITETLMENNPDLLGPEELKERALSGEPLDEIARDGLDRLNKNRGKM
jgi:hypothetical protein